MRLTEDLLADCALVVAHADDEAVWFSSVLRGVRDVIVCFLDFPRRPEFKRGRLKTFAAYPRSGISCLELDEIGAFNLADWEAPERTAYGLHLARNLDADELYRNNFDELEKRLRDSLGDVKAVITHNPWGEYGHEDHIQVYAAVCRLQAEMGFRIFYTSYASNRSLPLMFEHFRGFRTDYCRMETDVELAKQIAEIYKTNECWTWYSDYEWFEEDFFIEHSLEPVTAPACGQLAPINLIKVDFGLQKKAEPKKLRTRLARQAKGWARRFGTG